MRTLRQLEKYFTDNELRHPHSDDDWYDLEFSKGGRKIFGGYYGDEQSYIGGTRVGYSVTQASFCCGVYEMGNFVGGRKEPVEFWKAAIEWFLVANKMPYLRTETITVGNQHRNLERALQELGFRLVTIVPSKHGKSEGKRYRIKVWEWLKKSSR